MPLLARSGVIASMQPTHCTSDIPLTTRMLAGRGLASYAWRSLLDAGATVAFGSDAPVEDPDPFFGIHAAVTRQQPDGTRPAASTRTSGSTWTRRCGASPRPARTPPTRST